MLSDSWVRALPDHSAGAGEFSWPAQAASQLLQFSPKHTAALRHLHRESPRYLTLHLAPNSLLDSSPDLNLLLAHLRAEPLTYLLPKPETWELAITLSFLSSLNLIHYQVVHRVSTWPWSRLPHFSSELLWDPFSLCYPLQFLPHTRFQEEAFLEGKSDPTSSLLKRPAVQNKIQAVIGQSRFSVFQPCLSDIPS